MQPGLKNLDGCWLYIFKHKFTHNPVGLSLRGWFVGSGVYDKCEKALLGSGLVYVFCDESGRVVGEPFRVSNGDFVSFQLDLSRLDLPFDVYVVCVYSDFPLVEVGAPSVYLGSTVAVSRNFSCGGQFRRGDYHHVGWAGYVFGRPGNYTFVRVYVFDGRRFTPYMSLDEYFSRLDEAVVVFEKYLVLE